MLPKPFQGNGGYSSGGDDYGDMTAGAGIGGIIGGLFGGGYGGDGGASQTMANAMAQGKQNVQPYMNAGQNALNTYQNALGGMSNPGQFINQIMQGYQASPQAQYAMQQGIKSANAAGAASGMLGSGAEQLALQQNANDIIARDQQQYLNNRLGVYNTYLRGEGGLEQGGLQAGESLNDFMGRMAQAQAQEQAAQAAEQQQSRSNEASGIGGLAGGLIGKGISDMTGGLL